MKKTQARVKVVYQACTGRRMEVSISWIVKTVRLGGIQLMLVTLLLTPILLDILQICRVLLVPLGNGVLNKACQI